MKDWVKRLMGRSVVDLAQEVDNALARLAEAQGLEAQCQVALAAAEADVRHAREDVAAARDALFKEHPHLVPDQRLVTWNPPADHAIDLSPGAIMQIPNDALPEGANPAAWEAETVEVDDADDPRFTSGVPAVSPNEEDDLPPIVWTERDE